MSPDNVYTYIHVRNMPSNRGVSNAPRVPPPLGLSVAETNARPHCESRAGSQSLAARRNASHPPSADPPPCTTKQQDESVSTRNLLLIMYVSLISSTMERSGSSTAVRVSIASSLSPMEASLSANPRDGRPIGASPSANARVVDAPTPACLSSTICASLCNCGAWFQRPTTLGATPHCRS